MAERLTSSATPAAGVTDGPTRCAASPVSSSVLGVDAVVAMQHTRVSASPGVSEAQLARADGSDLRRPSSTIDNHIDALRADIEVLAGTASTSAW